MIVSKILLITNEEIYEMCQPALNELMTHELKKFLEEGDPNSEKKILFYKGIKQDPSRLCSFAQDRMIFVKLFVSNPDAEYIFHQTSRKENDLPVGEIHCRADYEEALESHTKSQTRF